MDLICILDSLRTKASYYVYRILVTLKKKFKKAPETKSPKKNTKNSKKCFFFPPKSFSVGYCSLPKSMPKVGSDEDTTTVRAHAHKLAGPPGYEALATHSAAPLTNAEAEQQG